MPLPLNDLVAEHPLFVVLEDEEIPPLDLVLLEQRVRLHLHLLDLQLVHFTEQAQHLALLLGADALRKLLKKKENNKEKLLLNCAIIEERKYKITIV